MLWSNISEITGRCKEDSFNQLWRNATGRFTSRAVLTSNSTDQSIVGVIKHSASFDFLQNTPGKPCFVVKSSLG